MEELGVGESFMGRELTTKETPSRLLFERYQTGASEYEKAITVLISDIDRQVAEYTDSSALRTVALALRA